MKTISELYDNMGKVFVGKMMVGSGIEKNKIWLEKEDGEGGDFPVEEVEKILLKYFLKNF